MGAALPVTALSGIDASAAVSSGRTLTHGDAAILRFLAAAELLESDLWTQYSELGGVGGGNAAYVAALQNLDGDMPQYITDNTDDELSHAAFLNAYLSGNINRLVVVEHLAAAPSPKTAWRGLAETIKALFVRS